MLKKILVAALLLPLLAFGQSYPSPTFNNLTVQGTFTATGNVGLPSLAAQAANTVVGNATGSSASPTAITVTGCNGAAQALQWTNGSGFGCNSNIATSGANANITSLSGLSTPLSVAQGGTGAATLTANGVLFGNGTGGVGATSVGTAAQVLTSNGAGVAPTFQAFTGRLLGIQTFTATGTYTPTAGTNSVIVYIVGGGGAGGGTPATSGTQNSVGGAGGSGAWAIGRITSGFSGVTVTIGAAGAGSSGAVGGNGGQSSFGAAITAPGGIGGAVGTLITSGTWIVQGGSTSATASGASILNSAGNAGQSTPFIFGSFLQSGPGANGPFGTGGNPIGSNSAGATATGKGAGGSGSVANISQGALAGGNGSAGLCIVYEYQ